MRISEGVKSALKKPICFSSFYSSWDGGVQHCVQSQKAVSAYFKITQILHFVFAEQYKSNKICEPFYLVITIRLSKMYHMYTAAYQITLAMAALDESKM